MADFAQEGGHWYLPDGTPYYTVKSAKGTDRPVTLRDARKVGAVPSVTTVIRLMDAPGLTRWLITTAIEAALTLPRIEGESSDAFLARVEQDRKAQAKAAAEKGVAIHGAIERHYRGELGESSWSPWIIEASGELTQKCGPQQWKPERSFANPAGFGGKTDLHSQEWCVDVKTKDGDLSATTYDEHVMQLAAYRVGLGIGAARAGILFVRRDKPAALFCEIERKELDRGWAMFQALLAFHQAKTGYKP